MATARRNIRAIRPRTPSAPSTTIINLTMELGGKERVFAFDPARLPLIFIEAMEEMQQDGSWSNMRIGIQKLLKLTDEESLDLDTDSIGVIAAAIKEATDIPNDAS